MANEEPTCPGVDGMVGAAPADRPLPDELPSGAFSIYALPPDTLPLDTVPPDAAAQIGGLVFALIVIDRQGRIAQANPATEELFGRSARRLCGDLLGEVLGPLDPRIERGLAEANVALVARDITIRPRSDRMLVNLTVSPVASHRGWRVVTISPLKPGDMGPGEEPELPGAPSILAHEIKNPLAAIRGAGQLAARKLAKADRMLADTIVAEADRIASLIDRMQRLGTQTREAPAASNPHAAIRDAIAMLRRGREPGDRLRRNAGCGMGGEPVSAKLVPVLEEFDPSLPPALVHRDALEQVVVNLLSNAIEAIGDRTDGEVTVRTRFANGGMFTAIRLGRQVRLPIEITVSDNGPGVDPALRERLFEPFVSSKRAGQGLGLALVRKLMHDMDGSVSHERDERAGLTHFHLRLPRAPCVAG